MQTATDNDQSAPTAPEAIHPAVRVCKLVKSFGQFTALKDVDLDIVRGELICFLGPSGCGKTTLLRAIAGLDPQTSGTIELAGRDVTHEPPSARDFGIVFQSYALFPNLTVRDNVAYGLVNRRHPKAEIAQRVAELLALVGLEDQATKYPAQLSGGQQQRVALARAIATSPSLLLLDEPLSALDARVRVRLRGEIKSLQRRLGLTTILVTHDQEEALAMADRIAVMNQGQIEQIGTPEEIYRHPATPFVAEFIGTMNFLGGVVGGEGRVAIQGSASTGSRIDLPIPAARDFARGTSLRVGFRPEDVRIRDLTPDTPNRLMAKVTKLEFLGSFCRATLVLEQAPDIALLADLSINDVSDLEIAIGRFLAIALPPEALRLYPVAAIHS